MTVFSGNDKRQHNGVIKIGDEVAYADLLENNDSTHSLQVTTSSNGSVNIGVAPTSAAADAFGRFRVSNPITLFDSKQIFDNQPLFWDDAEVSGSNTNSVYTKAHAKTTISVDDLTAGKRVRQTYQSFNYQPGKSQQVLMTFKFGTAPSGIIKTVGIHNDDNGLFFKKAAGVHSFVQRSSVTGSAVDTEITQDNWNIDTLDGNGFSGISLDSTKTQILFIDYEWLGVGRVRMGFVIDGIIYYCHQFLNTNNLSTVYMSTPNLPLRYSIENDGTGPASTLDCICASVISEGGSDELGTVRHASTNGTHVTMTTENTIYAILGIRLKSTYIGANIKILNVSLQIQSATDQIEWLLILNPTVAGTFTYSDETNSAVQIARGATANTVTGGIFVLGDYIESGVAATGGAGSGAKSINNAVRLGQSISGTVDEIVLCARPIGGSTSVEVEGGINWIELS